jgi:hypothetical protein
VGETLKAEVGDVEFPSQLLQYNLYRLVSEGHRAEEFNRRQKEELEKILSDTVVKAESYQVSFIQAYYAEIGRQFNNPSR